VIKRLWWRKLDKSPLPTSPSEGGEVKAVLRQVPLEGDLGGLRAVFPGSFDPFTFGHKAIVEQALPLFDTIVIAIGVNNTKKSLFSVEQRVAHIRAVFAGNPKIEVATYDALTIDFCKTQNAHCIIRGLRNSIDFEFEKSIAQANSELCPEVQTLFFTTPAQFSHISSSIVRDLIQYKRSVESYIPKSDLLEVV